MKQPVPTSSGDGKTVAIVENLYGYARTLAIASPGQKLNRLKVEPKRRLSKHEAPRSPTRIVPRFAVVSFDEPLY